MAERSALMDGTVVASHGRHCMVETPDGERRICHPRGKKSQAVVGDHVLWQAPPPGQGEEGTIEKVKERRNLFYRQDEIRTKSFAANLDQVLILIAAEPVFSESQLARALIAAEAEGIKPIIALNKSDLVEPFARAWERLLPYRHMGAGKHYGVLPLSLALSSDEFPWLPPERLAALPMPVLLMAGEHTPPIHAAIFRNVCAAMPQAEQVLIDGAGHVLTFSVSGAPLPE